MMTVKTMLFGEPRKARSVELNPTSAPKSPEWPLWARLIRSRQSPEDKGLGDTVARVIGPIGGNAFKVWYLAVFGKACGCAGRQAEWNLRYPYPLT